MSKDASSKMPWKLLALILFGGVIRLSAVDAQSFWYDEAFTANIARESVPDLVSGRARDNGNPPLFWVIARGWSKVFGTSEAAWRSLPALCSTIAIWFVYLVARRVADERAGLLSALLFSISPSALELADEARCFALLQLLAVVSTWLFLRWNDSGGAGRLMAYAVSIAAIALTHYYGFAVPVVHSVALLAARPDRRRVLSFLGAMALAAGVFSFWIPQFFAQLGTKGNMSRMGADWTMQFLGTPIVFAFGRMLAWKESPLWQLMGGTAAALLFLWLPAALGIWTLRRDRMNAVLLAGWWLMPIVGPLVVAVLFSPIYATRYATVGLPAFVILAGIGLSSLRWSIAAPALGGIAALSLISISNYFTHPIKPDWRQATAAILQSAHDSEPIVFDPEFEVVPFKYYLPADKKLLPRPLYGVTSLAPDGRLMGVIHRGSAASDGVERPILDELVNEESFSLLVGGSVWPLEKYREVFGASGFVAEEPRVYYRIVWCRFVKSARPE
jgi:uncharacterized membrane protein